MISLKPLPPFASPSQPSGRPPSEVTEQPLRQIAPDRRNPGKLLFEPRHTATRVHKRKTEGGDGSFRKFEPGLGIPRCIRMAAVPPLSASAPLAVLGSDQYQRS